MDSPKFRRVKATGIIGGNERLFEKLRRGILNEHFRKFYSKLNEWDAHRSEMIRKTKEEMRKEKETLDKWFALKNVSKNEIEEVDAVIILSIVFSTAVNAENTTHTIPINEKEYPSTTATTTESAAVYLHEDVMTPESTISHPIYLPLRMNSSISDLTIKTGLSRLNGAFEKEVEKMTTPNGLKRITRRQVDDKGYIQDNGPCRSFLEDVSVKDEFEFFSPGYGQTYPSQIDCVKTITAPPGYLLRLDFRNAFDVEQSEECRFDYLEIRDGAHGYSNLIGTFCGNRHPPPITSSDRYLWLRFASDETIQNTGFHAVYWFIPRPTSSDHHPEIEMCRIEVNGSEGFANRTDIDDNRVRMSVTYGIPLDCMWIISVQEGWKIMLQFLKFKLEKPNDCDSNFVDVFSDRTDLPSRLKNFCGSIADSVISRSNILHLRFFAEARSINSTFEALFTAFRDKPRDEACHEDEYDCEDATCISIDLRCNGRVNCRFRWDEDECQPKLGAFAVILESEHIIIILVVFCLILSGMCFAFLFNCTKKLVRDHRIIQEHLRQSRENELNTMGRKERQSGLETALQKVAMSGLDRSRSNSSSGESLAQEFMKNGVKSEISNLNRISTLPRTRSSRGEECFPSAGAAVPAFDGRKSVSAISSGETRECDLGEVGDFTHVPETKDSGCQTRESLFSTQLIDVNPVCEIPPPKKYSQPPFSTFGYTSDGAGRKEPSDGKRYKAEAVIEVDGRKKGENSISGQESFNSRPFSIDSTKSAPDVIVTH